MSFKIYVLVPKIFWQLRWVNIDMEQDTMAVAMSFKTNLPFHAISWQLEWGNIVTNKQCH